MSCIQRGTETRTGHARFEDVLWYCKPSPALLLPPASPACAEGISTPEGSATEAEEESGAELAGVKGLGRAYCAVACSV